ncbi:MAG: undecaprenyl/decaprenyl-phosphate alpha-N-acetylglucosaminyl 1-phosphate transferase [Meiothermus sp.]|uniref:MraY family glycosyltransferase n=1 Tax=Meiothermus sp. TaxID=1955249 RepID=UPI00262E8A13|nr:MraY family glycosyltransferase [Meiothermus sp.]MCS7058059.1 undecaprenyl/decaprenyl-phosphate alpha-N-acetylglucosaminyl 1-phosphate transferase [Meiothermus sp.]MCX7740135.1 undecaprenyl/decaprenyl-phosphate alpha-N-acetylglucosaminyl 1-phosphate transferase [Meiothermus sp.]MDW8091837.1 MraY family glycosyltransferase [Meiothermus sp.]MDW8482610.1 MraY family glycosyltransferase [Meiothermus sp.]
MTEFLKAIGIANPGGTGWLTVVFTFVVAWIVTWRFIPRVRQFALKVGWADHPNARRLNKEPLPNAGGLAIFAGVVAALVVATALRPILIQEVQVQVLAILLGGSILVLVGFVDDQFGLPPLFRLLVQLLAALLLVAVDIRFHAAFGTALDPLLGILLTLVWVVGITNAVNLMDGVDGLAGGVAFITAMSLLAVSAQSPQWAAATLVLSALAGAALGFLRHNFYPSKIIMGDAGAYFFGYVLAATALLGSLKLTTAFSLVPTALFLLLPILDTTQVFVQRLLRGQNPMATPGKDHIHHRLLARGFSQRRTTLTLWTITLLFNLLAMRVQGLSPLVIGVTALGTALLLGFTVWRKLRAVWKEAEGAAHP